MKQKIKTLIGGVLFLVLLAGCGSPAGPATSGMANKSEAGFPAPEMAVTSKLGADPLSLETDSSLEMGEQISLTPDLSVRQIQDGVYEFTHAFPWAANSLAVVMGDHLVLVDTPWTPQATEEMLTWLANQMGEKQVAAINTHFHLDNLGGNAYLVHQGIPVYGSVETVELLGMRGAAMLAQTVEWMKAYDDPRYAAAFKNFDLVFPTELFMLSDGLKLSFGGEEVQVYYPGPGHTPDNVVVYFPKRKLLFGGCMIVGWDSLGNIGDADLASWPDSVRNLKKFDFDILVPGHGDSVSPDLIEHTLNLLEALP